VLLTKSLVFITTLLGAVKRGHFQFSYYILPPVLSNSIVTIKYTMCHVWMKSR